MATPYFQIVYKVAGQEVNARLYLPSSAEDAPKLPVGVLNAWMIILPVLIVGIVINICTSYLFIFFFFTDVEGFSLSIFARVLALLLTEQ